MNERTNEVLDRLVQCILNMAPRGTKHMCTMLNGLWQKRDGEAASNERMEAEKLCEEKPSEISTWYFIAAMQIEMSIALSSELVA